MGDSREVEENSVAMETDWMARIEHEEAVDKMREKPATLVFRSAENDKVNGSRGDGGSRVCGAGGVQMPQAYAQCRAARESDLKKPAIEISAVPNFGCEIGEHLKPIGSFQDQSEGAGGCYLASRVQRGGKLAN